MIDGALLALGDVTTVDGRVGTFFGANRMILGMQLLGLCAGDLAAGFLLIDPGILIGQARIDFGTTWVRRIKLGCGGRRLCHGR